MADGAVPAGWINAMAGKFCVATVDGQKVLQKAPDNTLFKRLRMFFGGLDQSNYTVEADVRVATRRRQMGDIGITAQRYSLVLYGTSQRLKIEPWEPETERTVTCRLRGRPTRGITSSCGSRTMPTASVRARGKAWPTGEAGAGGVDDREARSRSATGRARPGVFADAEFGAYLDNLKLTPNQ